MALVGSSWEGSSTTLADIQRLRQTRHIPDGVVCCLPGMEMALVLEPDESVPHHLSANAYLSLSYYATWCEGFAGLWPQVDFWCRLFFPKAQTADGKLRTCGAASLYPRWDVPFPKIPTFESVKKWQTTFFYVKNANPTKDLVNLPAFSPAPPTAKLNWGHDPKSNDLAAEVNRLMDRLRDCVTRQGLMVQDLIAAFISRRVLPL
ncbi:hypothetical protein ACQ4PT_041348 [Festuca glaucescens]